MKRIEKAFNKVTQLGDKAFVPYIMAGDGGLSVLEEQVRFLAKAGATAIEIGIPFSDPVADGPVIQAAGIRALKEGTTLRSVLETIKTFGQEVETPLVLMTYMNPIIAYGIETFVQSCVEAGVDGVIVPDLPIEEEDIITLEADKAGLEIIRLVTLTSPIERIKAIASKGKGFLYAVTVTGTTGARATFQENLAEHLQKVKSVSNLPVLAGFGISTPEHVREMTKYCDGVIVGSKIVDLFEKGKLAEIEELIKAAKNLKQNI